MLVMDDLTAQREIEALHALLRVAADDDDLDATTLGFAVITAGTTVTAVWEELLSTRERHIVAGRSTNGGGAWTVHRVDHAPTGAVASTPALVRGMGGAALDHNHKTGKFRGILCAADNQALGLVQDNPDRLRQLIAYLDENESFVSEV